MDDYNITRRDFLRIGAIGSIASIPWIDWACKHKDSKLLSAHTNNWIDEMINYYDQSIPDAIKTQHTDPSLPFFGAIPDAFGIHNPHGPAGLILTLTCVYVSPQSRYYHDASILKRMDMAIDYVLKAQHSDGTIDLLATNFHSTPDLGFVTDPLAQAFKLLKKDHQDDTLELRTRLQTFLFKAGDALSIGGIHTPNHRWVVCMALARINELFPNEKYVKRIEQWLAEKIDIDQDGQYNERSTSTYSPLVDRWLITIARLMNKPDLYQPVKKNLDMTQYLIHPNGDLVTEISKRQDQYTSAPCSSYFYSYHFMSTYFKDEASGAMASWIKTKYGIKNLSGALPYILEDEKLRPEPGSALMPPDHYEKYFETSKLVRWRDGTTDATMVADNSRLFSFYHEGIILGAIRCATAFFGKGQFIGDQMKKTDQGYEISQKLEGPYYQPYPIDSLPGDGDWNKMPKEKRLQSEVQAMTYILHVRKVQDGFKLDFSLNGTDGVPVAIELSFKKNGEHLSNLEPVPDIADAYFLKQGIGRYQSDHHSVWVQGGRHDHGWTALRGALPKLEGNSIYITGYTPFNHQIILSTREII